ncbi:MAG: cysteine desulfurase NifS [Deltaproteobacteria bacterium]|nr:cysteine desulfurase NifS [Deltaproteobacteria bacterium]
MERKIYFDNNATTPIRREAFEKMIPFLTEHFGNPSSVHWAGRRVSQAIEEARGYVAKLLNATDREIVFTAGGSESDNHAIKGAFFANKQRGRHIITTKVEHPAVLETVKDLKKFGADVTFLNVDENGELDLQELESAIRPDTILVTIMYANNETGVIFPIKEITQIVKRKNPDILVHTDAVQVAGKERIDIKDLGVDLLSISGHKIYAPKGVGALFIKKGVKIDRLISGGHQERNRRAGTENVASIVAFGEAARLAMEEIDEEKKRLSYLRDKLENAILQKIPYVKLNGHKTKRLCNTTNLSFKYVEGEGILLSLDMVGIAASSGSACTSGSLDPSHVLLAMGLDHETAHGSVRISLGRFNTEEEVDYFIRELPPIIERLRQMSPLYNRRPDEPEPFKVENAHNHKHGEE